MNGRCGCDQAGLIEWFEFGYWRGQPVVAGTPLSVPMGTSTRVINPRGRVHTDFLCVWPRIMVNGRNKARRGAAVRSEKL